MGKERVIFSNRFDRPTLEQIEEEMKKENYDDNENLMSAEEFLDFMKKNRRTIPNERRIANKDKFIWAVRELSETYEIDADLIEDDDGYTASLYMNYASYNGYIKKLLGLIFILSDDFYCFFLDFCVYIYFVFYIICCTNSISRLFYCIQVIIFNT